MDQEISDGLARKQYLHEQVAIEDEKKQQNNAERSHESDHEAEALRIHSAHRTTKIQTMESQSMESQSVGSLKTVT
jgi:hypothetical protein